MPDLVDYLREKLEHSDDVTCTCPDVEITTWLDPEPVFTKWPGPAMPGAWQSAGRRVGG